MARIVVVGSVATDEVFRLNNRLREGGHLNGQPVGARLGGGGANTAVALAAAGHHAILVAAIGSDEAGRWQVAELARAGVDVSAIKRVSGASTHSLCLIDPAGERTIVNLGRAQEAEAPRRLLELDADLVYVRSRSPRLLAPLLTEVARTATVIAHVPPLDEGAFPAQVVVTSRSDLDAAVLADPVGAARRVAGDLLRWVVVTRGADGAEAHSTTGAHLSCIAPEAEAIDTVGAGDAFAAGLCHALAGGQAMDDALCAACRWGAAKVAVAGSALTADAVRALV